MAESPGSDDSLEQLAYFYRKWNILARYGVIGLFVYLSIRYVRFIITDIVSFIAIICGGMIYMVFWVAPSTFLLLTGTGLYYFARRSEHLICFAVTLGVTWITWAVTHDVLVNPLSAWLVALMAGILSGVVAELARGFILVFCDTTKLGKIIADGRVDYVASLPLNSGMVSCLFDRLGRLLFEFPAQSVIVRHAQ